MNWQKLWEAVKEPLRLLIIAIISFAIAELSQVEQPTQLLVVLVLVLRFVDKLIFLNWKEGKDPSGWRGLVGF